MLKKYKIGFDVRALVLFLAVMLPNFYWFAVEAPNDVLRGESITPAIDTVASICQIVMVATLCSVKRRDILKIKWSRNLLAMVICYMAYLISWAIYYQGIVSPVIVLLLCLAPCLTFGFYSFDRKNILVLIPLGVFSACHLIYGIVNFIV